MYFLVSAIKIFPLYFLKKSTSCISQNETYIFLNRKFILFQEIELSNRKNKKFQEETYRKDSIEGVLL